MNRFLFAFGLIVPTISDLMARRSTVKRPFLKWAGSKTRLIGPLKAHLPLGKHRYVEPFVGSGAAFLNTDYPQSILCDSNQDLIDLYLFLKQAGEDFIRACKEFFTAANNTSKRFYELRADFNQARRGQNRASLFLYLNRHCYNGLCRYNSKGEFNTPFGRYERPYFPQKEMTAFMERLQTAELKCQDFRQTFAEVRAGDVVYCDPPYVPLSKTAYFTDYATGGFRMADQKELAHLCEQAAQKGAVVLVSNHDTPATESLYANAFQTMRVLVPRMISCNGNNRKSAKELIAVFRADGSQAERLNTGTRAGRARNAVNNH